MTRTQHALAWAAAVAMALLMAYMPVHDAEQDIADDVIQAPIDQRISMKE